MTSENQFLLQAFLMGIYITFVYDWFRILRRVIPHGNLMISIEDLLFWGYCGIKVFWLMYCESNFNLRWFAIVGAITGMYLYIRLVSPFFVKYLSKLLGKFVHLCYRMKCQLGKLKNKLTSPVKVHKMDS